MNFLVPTNFLELFSEVLALWGLLPGGAPLGPICAGPRSQLPAHPAGWLAWLAGLAGFGLNLAWHGFLWLGLALLGSLAGLSWLLMAWLDSSMHDDFIAFCGFYIFSILGASYVKS